MTASGSEVIYTGILLDSAIKHVRKSFLKPTSESSIAAARETPRSGLTDEHSPVH